MEALAKPWHASVDTKPLHIIHLVYATLKYSEVAVSTASIVNFLKQSDIFYQFTPTQLELVANLCQEAIFQKDDLIFKENSSSKELYIIVQGEVDIFVDPSLVRYIGSRKRKQNDCHAATRSIVWRGRAGG